MSRVKAGETYASAAADWGITRERVRQICKRAGVESVRAVSAVERLRRENADLRAHLAVHERLRHEAETDAQRDARAMAWRRLYVAANDLAAVLGYAGEIDAQHPDAEAFMARLDDLDDGTFDPQIANAMEPVTDAALIPLDGTSGDVRG